MMIVVVALWIFISTCLIVITAVSMQALCDWVWPGPRRVYSVDVWTGKEIRESWSSWLNRGWSHE